MKFWMFFVLFVLAAVPLRAATPLRVVTDEDVDRAIGEARRYLWGQQKADGQWNHHWKVPKGGDDVIAVFALLESGEDHDSEKMKLGLDALAKLETNDHYVIATRSMAFSQI